MSCTVKFYGASDDLVEVDGEAPGCDEYPSERELFTVLTEGDGQVRIEVSYSGEWSVRIVPIDEDTRMPDVLVTQSDRGYSAVATVEGVTRVIRERVEA